jgi:hypothetical protein
MKRVKAQTEMAKDVANDMRELKVKNWWERARIRKDRGSVAKETNVLRGQYSLLPRWYRLIRPRRWRQYVNPKRLWSAIRIN